jgi:phage baseplate assembly protein gpV
MFDLARELEELSGKYPDRREGGVGLYKFEERQMRRMASPMFGTVADNRDPRCLGRLKVACDTMAPGAVTGWIPVIRTGVTKDSGWWELPEVGTQVLLGFVGNSMSRPVVLGYIYDLKHKPPGRGTGKAVGGVVLQTKNHRVEVEDEEGKESIIISTAGGKIRYSVGAEGIELVNELGDIEIRCRKLRVEGGEGIEVAGKKKVVMESGGDLGIRAGKSIRAESDGEITVQGKNIRLEGSRGITSGGKQLAKEGDKVMGFDVHQMQVPAGPGVAVVPLPHPYLGKLAGGLSKDVKINGHNAAVKGSTSKHNDAMHLQLPGTISFVKAPSGEGEVTGGTGKKVKINGKEAAVIGSTVTTCNDIGARDNSAVIAAGVSIPMPVIINPKNAEEYEREREEGEGRKPEFQAVNWGKGRIREGEEVELSAGVKDIDDGNMVTFQVWKEGQDPASQISQERITGSVEGGMAKGKWTYRAVDVGEEAAPEEDPRYYFTAHSAWCGWKESGRVEVELKRPEVREAVWHNAEGKEAGTGQVGEVLKMGVTCNKDMEEGAGVVLKVYAEGSDPRRDKPVAEIGSSNKAGKAEAAWAYEYRHDPENPLKEKPKYFFTAKGKRSKEAKSGNVEIGMEIDIPVCFDNGEAIADIEYTLTGINGAEEKGRTNSNGRIQSDSLLPGNYEISIDWLSWSQPEGESELIERDEPDGKYSRITVPQSNERLLCKLAPGKDYMICVDRTGSGVSQ